MNQLATKEVTVQVSSGSAMAERVKIFKNEITCTPPNLTDLEKKERDFIIKTLNMLNENDYSVNEAIRLLELGIEALKYVPVVKYE
ncbi:MAG: hypothetical protein N4A63_09545 [Vallitalea sp.]|jgi:hypothetical protein|nr:hypothetical protein [Vallitalea sp.]